MQSFIERCLEGSALPEDIDDYIEQWNEEDTGQELEEFLGMTIQEFCDWVLNPALLTEIILSRRAGIPWQRKEANSAAAG